MKSLLYGLLSVIFLVASLQRTGAAEANSEDPGETREGVNRQFGSAAPRVGQSVPDVTAYSADGTEFPLRSLRDHYTVLVFGCLT